MTSPNRMMKNTCVTIVIKHPSSSLLQRKDIDILVQKVAKQWKLRSNGHLTYSIPHNNHNLNMYSLQYFSQFQQGCRKLFRAVGGNRAKGASRVPGAIRRQRGESRIRGILPYFVIIIFWVILAQSKHQVFHALLPP